ncbi:MAG: RNA polymerase sigma factor [Planctomycetota bacterium]
MHNRQRKVLELLETSGARLHELLARLTLSEDAVGDLMQELFIRLSNSNGLDKAKDPFAYAHRAAVNLAFEWRRRQKVKYRSLDEDCFPVQTGSSPLRAAIRREELEKLLDATSQLSDLAREVVVMHYIEQESYEEISGRLGKKSHYLRSLSSKALARLRTLLADE